MNIYNSLFEMTRERTAEDFSQKGAKKSSRRLSSKSAKESSRRLSPKRAKENSRRPSPKRAKESSRRLSPKSAKVQIRIHEIAIAVARVSGVDNRDVALPPDKKPDTRRSAITNCMKLPLKNKINNFFFF